MATIAGSATVQGYDSFQAMLKGFNAKLEKEVRSTLIKIGQVVATEAKRRVPVYGAPTGSGRDKKTGRFTAKAAGDGRGGTLRQSIRYELRPGATPDTTEVHIGTNVDYGIFLEFGTARIAKGAVKKLGLREGVLDSDAVHSWPALVSRGGSGQQMPWLRPAANHVRPQAMAALARAMGTARKGL